jgi:ATP-binding cassette, subfamily D (ALD), member 4
VIPLRMSMAESESLDDLEVRLLDDPRETVVHKDVKDDDEDQKAETVETKHGDHAAINWYFVRSLFALLRHGFRDKKRVLLFLAAAICVFLESVFFVLTQLSYGLMFYAIFNLESIPLALLAIFIAFIFICLLALSYGLLIVFAERFSMEWRRCLSSLAQGAYFKDRAYYKINVLDKVVDNPDQRMVTDIADACKTFTHATFGSPEFQGIIYSLIQIGVWSLIAVALGAFWIIGLSFAVITLVLIASKLASLPVASLVYKLERREGGFRYSHVRFRTYAECIALYDGVRREEHTITSHLAAVTAAAFRLVRASFPMYYTSYFINLALIPVTVTFYFISATLFGTHCYIVADVVPLCVGKVPNVGILTLVIVSGTSIMTSTADVVSLIGMVSDLAGFVGRIQHLLEALEIGTSKKKSENESGKDLAMGGRGGVCVDSDRPTVAFDRVEILSPLGRVLIRDINLTVNRGESMVIMGQSGCGKSSLMRVLGGLWEFPAGGIIERPFRIDSEAVRTGFVRPPTIYFLSQRPYIVRGTISDNIVYPSHEVLSIAEIVRLLRLAALPNLLDRIQRKVDIKLPWEDILSVGEQQRLGFARLFYHCPTFAVMDESTSALDVDTEQQLLFNVLQSEITMISIAHRPSVIPFHKQMLTVADQSCQLQAIEETALGIGEGLSDSAEDQVAEAEAQLHAERLKLYTEAQREVEEVAEERMEDLQAVTHFLSAPKGASINWLFFKRLHRLIGLTAAHDKWQIVRFVGACILAIISAWLVALHLLLFNGLLLGAALDDNLPLFVLTLVVLIGLTVVVPILQSGSLYYGGMFATYLRLHVTTWMHQLYFSADNLFYNLLFIDSKKREAMAAESKEKSASPASEVIDNPDQRMVDDINKSAFTLTAILFGQMEFQGLLLQLGKISLFACYTFVLVGPLGILAAVAFILVSTAGTKILASPVISRVVKQEEREGDFRLAHTRVRTYAESIALYDGGKREESEVDFAMSRLFRMVQRLIYLRLPLNTFSFFLSYMSYLYSFLVCLAIYPIHKYLIDASGLGGLIFQVTGLEFPPISYAIMLSISNALSNIVSSWSAVMEFGSRFSDLAGYVARVGSLLERLEELDGECNPTHTAESGAAGGAGQYGTAATASHQPSAWTVSDHCIALAGVQIINPVGRSLVRDLELTLHAASGTPSQDLCTSVVIMGPSGCGKTSVLRVIMGLWPVYGKLQRPAVGPKTLLCLSQRPYLITGSLYDQVCYPGNESISHEECLALFERVGLQDLLSVHDPTDATIVWEDVLSLGEQQRLAFARLLFNRPRFAILDESTSALDVLLEEKCYQSIRDAGIAFISVAHRPSTLRFHHSILKLTGDGTWSLEPVASKVG